MLISILRGLKRATGDLNLEEVLKGGFISAEVKPLTTRGNRYALLFPAIHRVDVKQGGALSIF